MARREDEPAVPINSAGQDGKRTRRMVAELGGDASAAIWSMELKGQCRFGCMAHIRTAFLTKTRHMAPIALDCGLRRRW